jgi:hypothetical protein
MKCRSPFALAVLAAALACSPVSAQRGGAGGGGGAVDIIRDATGQRRADLDKMELKDFPADAWGKLSQWTGDPITASGTDGKPVLILTWGSWHPASLRALSTAQQMAERFGPQGLIVVGAHHPMGWEKAEQIAKDRAAGILLAHDAQGDFRKALKIDKDPDWFIVDRAGHLRYTAVSTGSVEAAVAEVTGETREQAGDLPRIRRERAEREARARGRTTETRQDVELTALPAVPPGYVPPPEALYEAATWPKVDKELGQQLGLFDQQSGRQLTPSLSFSPEGYHPPRPPTIQGRAVVIYFWHPDVYASFGTTMPAMDLLQQQHPRDLAVIGALVPRESIDRSLNQGQQQMDAEAAERLARRYASFIQSRSFRHSLAIDPSGSSLASLGGQGSSVQMPLPGAIVVSSDGVIRWAGRVNSPDFKAAIDSIVANDPGVRARRQADRRYIETTKR